MAGIKTITGYSRIGICLINFILGIVLAMLLDFINTRLDE